MREGARLQRDDGAQVRIDRVADGWVYFVAWLPGQTYGAPKRMREATFREACEVAGIEVGGEAG